MTLSIIITCYNEAKTIEQVVNKINHLELPEAMDKEIIVVDDCSKDDSREILSRLKLAQPEIKLIFHEKNAGKGGALRSGIKEASGDYIVFQDADLELNPEDILRLLAPVLAGEVEMTLGSRFRGKNLQYINLSYWKYWLANKLINLMFNILYFRWFTDVNCGYKLFRADTVKGLELKSNEFEIEVEIIARMLKKGYNIKEVPVYYQPRNVKQGKKIRLRHAFRMAATMIECRFFNH